MFILNRIITTRIDRGFCFDTAKLYVYDFRNMYSPSYSYYVSPFSIEFNHIKHMSEDAKEAIINNVLSVYERNNLGKYASTLDEIIKMIHDSGEVIIDEDLQYQNIVKRLVECNSDTDTEGNIEYLAKKPEPALNKNSWNIEVKIMKDVDLANLEGGSHQTIGSAVDTAIAKILNENEE